MPRRRVFFHGREYDTERQSGLSLPIGSGKTVRGICYRRGVERRYDSLLQSAGASFDGADKRASFVAAGRDARAAATIVVSAGSTKFAAAKTAGTLGEESAVPAPPIIKLSTVMLWTVRFAGPRTATIVAGESMFAATSIPARIVMLPEKLGLSARRTAAFPDSVRFPVPTIPPLMESVCVPLLTMVKA